MDNDRHRGSLPLLTLLVSPSLIADGQRVLILTHIDKIASDLPVGLANCHLYAPVAPWDKNDGADVACVFS